MDIRTKDNELFYIGCMLSDAIERLERNLNNNKEKADNILNNPHLQTILTIKDKWVNRARNSNTKRKE